MKKLLGLVLLINMFACSKNRSEPQLIPVTTDTSGGYLALGDSYTIGQSVPVADRFPAQTVALLRQSGVSVSDPVYIAQTGWTTANLQTAIAQQNLPATFKIVSLLIGVNDQYLGMDTGSYALSFTQLLQKSVQLARGQKANVFVLSIPDYSVTSFVTASDKERVSREIAVFNSINRRITLAFGISYTDITPSSREAGINPALLSSDGLHPSGLEYRKWAEMLAPKIKAVLR